MFPYESIQKNADCSWTLKLVDAIAAGEFRDDELERINSTLESLGDWRAVAPLKALMLNDKLPEKVRAAAAEALNGLPSDETEAQRREWFASGDAVLMRYAIWTGEGTEQDIYLALATDPNHPLHKDGIDAIQYYDYAVYQDLLIKALDHPDAEVRKVAARGLIWDEPWRAEEPLLRIAAQDIAEVASEALDTLCYFESKRVLSELSKLKEDGRAEHKVHCENVIYWVCEEIARSLSHISDEQRAFVDAYLEPVAHILESAGEDDDDEDEDAGEDEEEDQDNDQEKDADLENSDGDEAESQLEQKHEPDGKDSQPDSSATGDDESEPESYLTAQAAIEAIETIGLSQDGRRVLEGAIKWNEFSEADRLTMADYLTGHLAPAIRCMSIDPLIEWQMFDRVVALIDDQAQAVARAAQFKLKKIPRDESLAPKLWHIFKSGRWCGSALIEVFDSFLAHAPEEGLNDLLAELFWNDQRDAIKLQVIWALSKRESYSVLESFFPYLQRQPLINWAVHALIIEEFSRAPNTAALQSLDLSHLKEVDDFGLQLSLAGLEVLRARG